MIITIDFVAHEVDLIDFKPIFESGIQWYSVGDAWHTLDRSIDYDHYAASVTVEDEYEKVHTLFDALRASKKSTSTVEVYCTLVERIFGHEFLYGDFMPYTCLVDVQEEDFTTSTPNGKKIGTLTFTLLSQEQMHNRWKYDPDIFPTTLQVAKVSRTGVATAKTHRLFCGFAKSSLSTSTELFTLDWIGSSDDIAKGKIYLVNSRGASFSLVSPAGIYYYNNGVNSQNVSFYSLVDEGAQQDTKLGQMSVTYLIRH